ncbi:MAG: SurA N-terminal domain-containing protein [Armatimonadota bacterium]
MRNAPKTALLTVAAATVLATFITGCGNNSVATVDGVKISKQEYYDRLEQQPAGTDPETKKPIEAGAAVLQQMVTEKLIIRLAEKEKVPPTEEQVQDRLDQLKKATPNFSAKLKEVGITEDQLKREIRIQRAAFNLQTKGVTVSDDKVKQNYEENKNTLYTEPESANVAAIFAKDKADADKAVALLGQGVTFERVVQQYSQDPTSAAQGGKVSTPIIRDPGKPQPYQDAIMQTKVGGITKPIALPGGASSGYAIFKVLDHKDKRIKPLSEVQSQIKDQLLTELGQAKNPPVKEQLDKFREKAKVEVAIDKYKEFLKPKKAEPTTALPGMEGVAPEGK